MKTNYYIINGFTINSKTNSSVFNNKKREQFPLFSSVSKLECNKFGSNIIYYKQHFKMHIFEVNKLFIVRKTTSQKIAFMEENIEKKIL